MTDNDEEAPKGEPYAEYLSPFAPVMHEGRWRIVLDDETFDAFVAMLDQPVEPNAALVELFSRPQRIEVDMEAS